MAEVERTLAANKEAVDELIAAAERCRSSWTTPCAPGKWSPSQIVEHVARSLEESANMLAGSPTKFPNLPFFLRPVARGMVLKRVVRTGAFPKAKTNKAMNPEAGPATPADGRVRLEGALARFETACRACAKRSGIAVSSTFGRVALADYARFIELHTRHHRKQMPGA
jgi:hypothetical protein